MSLHRICDMVVESDLLLPELPEVSNRGPDCRFQLSLSTEPSIHAVDWFHHWRFADDEAEPWLSFGRCGQSYLLRFPGLADFLVSHDGSVVTCHPLRETPEVTVRHLFLDQIIPLILSRRERLVLHASAVLAPGGAIAFAGMSGQGKSTLAATLSRQGLPLLSDDCLVLRETPSGWVAIPSYPGVRLWPQTANQLFDFAPPGNEVAHYTNKRRVGDAGLVGFAERPARFGCLYFIKSDPGCLPITFETLSPQEAFMQVLNVAYNLDITDKYFLKEQFQTIGRLTADLSSYSLSYPRDFSALPEVRQSILDHQLIQKRS